VTVRPDVIPATLIALGVLACAVTALAMRPVPLSRGAGGEWARIDATWGAPILAQTFALDTVLAGTERRDPATVVRVPRGKTLGVRGWAYDAAELRTADRFAYRLDGGRWHDATYHLARNDVSISYKLPGVWDSGFEVDVPTAKLARGEHVLELATAMKDAYTVLPVRVRFSAAR
jgi:hypothetical protein